MILLDKSQLADLAFPSGVTRTMGFGVQNSDTISKIKDLNSQIKDPTKPTEAEQKLIAEINRINQTSQIKIRVDFTNVKLDEILDNIKGAQSFRVDFQSWLRPMGYDTIAKIHDPKNSGELEYQNVKFEYKNGMILLGLRKWIDAKNEKAPATTERKANQFAALDDDTQVTAIAKSLLSRGQAKDMGEATQKAKEFLGIA